jgi:hypothetical protein
MSGIAGLVYSVAAMAADCQSGLFGPPVEVPIAEVPFDPSAPSLSQDKVADYASRPEVLSLPVIVLASEGGPPYVLADGNHRMCALTVLGASVVPAYVVPHAAARRYMVLNLLISAWDYLALTNPVYAALLDPEGLLPRPAWGLTGSLAPRLP